MSIDLQKESVMPLSALVRHLPPVRPGKKPHVATVWRWAMKGCRGIHLEYTRLGGTMVTSLEAVQRFTERLAEADRQRTENDEANRPSVPKLPRGRTSKQREAAIARAEKFWNARMGR